MRAWMLGVAAITGLLLTVGLVLHKSPRSGSTGPESPSGSVVPGARAGRLGAAPVAPSGGELRIRGVVLDDHGPVAGVRVSASRPEAGQTLSELPCPPGEEPGALEDELLLLSGCVARASSLILELVGAREGEAPLYAEAVTAGDGTFVLEGLPRGSFTLWALGEHGAVSRPGVPSGVDGVELLLGEGLTLEGSVFGGQAPVPDARVTVIHAGQTRFFDVRTGEDGHFRIGPLPESRYLLAVHAEGWLPGLFPSDTLDGPESRLELFLPRGLTGRVLSGGSPARGVEVRLEFQSGSGGDTRVVKTDAEGRFLFESLSPDHYRLTAEQGGRSALAQFELAGDAPWPEVVLRLGEAFFVEGTVLDDAGRPVPGAHVSASLSETRRWAREARTGPDGRYRLGPVEPGFHTFQITAERYLRGYGLEEELKEGSGPVDFILQRAVSVFGTVVDPEGHPLPHIWISLLHPGSPNPRHGNTEAYTRADEDGRFVLDADEPGAYLLDIDDETVLPEQLEVRAPAEGVRVVLRRGGSVSGTFTDDQGLPVVRGWVELWEPGETGGARRMAHVDETGRFLLQGLAPGRYMLEATVLAASVDRSTVLPVEVKDGEQVEVSPRLEKGRSLSGVVVDGAGQPVAGAFVRADPSSPRPWRREEPKGVVVLKDAPRDVRSGPDGRFTLHHLGADAYDVSARMEGYQSLDEANVRVSADTMEVRLALERLGHIRGRLVDAKGAPITRFEVNGASRKDSGGAFAVPFYESGLEKLTLSVPGMARVLRSVPVRKGLDVDLGELRMGPGRRVRGRVLDAETSEPVQASIHFTDATLESTSPTSRVWSHSSTAEDGSFELSNVEARPLALLVSHVEYRLRRLSLDDRTEEVTVRLERGARIDVRVSDAQGQPMGAQLQFERDGDGGRSVYVAEGADLLSGLEPGPYTVRLSPLRGNDHPVFFRPRQVQVPASGRVALTFEGEPGGATVRVTVKAGQVRSVWLRPGGAPPISDSPGLEWALSSSLLAESEGESDEQWVLHNVPPGRATLLLVAEEGESRIHREELDVPSEGTLARAVLPDWRSLEEEEE
jgi:hypothetical protein